MDYIYSRKGHTYVQRVGGPDKVRLVCSPSQAQLMQTLFKQREVELCSRQHLLTDTPTPATPEQVLQSLQEVAEELPAAQGGWRTLESGELTATLWAVKLLEMMHTAETTESQGKQLHDLLEAHPLVLNGGLFAFNGLRTSALGAFMGVVYDPRRFGAADEPGLEQLYAELKLTNSDELRKLETPEEGTMDSTARMCAGLLLDTPYFQMPPDKVRRHPTLFPYHRYHQLCKESGSQPGCLDPLALWAATREVVRFLWTVWRQALGI